MKRPVRFREVSRPSVSMAPHDGECQRFRLVAFEVRTCRDSVAYHTCLVVLCFEVQRAMHRVVRSHGNKRGTIGSRSTSAVILTKYSARSQMFRSAPVDFGVILLRYSAVEDVPPCKQTADTGASDSSTFDDSSIELPPGFFVLTARTLRSLISSSRKKTIDTRKYALSILSQRHISFCFLHRDFVLETIKYHAFSLPRVTYTPRSKSV